MAINLKVPEMKELRPRITVLGVGGAGGNAVNNMIEAGLEGVDFVVANTDAQALSLSRTDRRIQLGRDTTQGLGAGARPEIGRNSAEEALETLDGVTPDVLIADIGLAGVDGFELIERIRQSSNTAIRDVPAAALTAYARAEDRVKVLKSGFQMHLAKPIDPAELVAAVAALSKRKRHAD